MSAAAEPAPARNVAEALARVMGELPAIGKDGRADPSQGGYAYRGIEQITREAQRLFAQQGLVFSPKVVSHEVIDILVRDKPWTDTRMLVEYTVHHGPSNTTLTVGPILAIGRDNSDKGANKCMTQAFKYALLQVLCISDGKDDGDAASVEADGRAVQPAEPPAWQRLGYPNEDALVSAVDVIKEMWQAVPDDLAGAAIKEWLKKRGYSARWPVAEADYLAYVEVIEKHAPALAAAGGQYAGESEAPF